MLVLAEGRFVHTKVHTFAVTTGDALKRVEALSPWNVTVSQRVVWPGRRFPKLKVASSNLVSRSILTRLGAALGTVLGTVWLAERIFFAALAAFLVAVFVVLHRR